MRKKGHQSEEQRARACVRSARALLHHLGKLVLQETPFGGQVYDRLQATVLHNRIKELLDSADFLLKPRAKP